MADGEKKKRCFSKCRRLTHADCLTKDQCYYTNGKTRKFCRLQHRFKMDKDCQVTRRYKKGEEHIAEQHLAAQQKKAEAQLKAKAVLTRFFRKTKHRRKAEFLKSICSDSGVCIAFGTSAGAIKQFFGGFTDFAYAKAPIIRIGNPSINGFVNAIHYVHRGYEAHAVLKSAMNASADNLMYEYLVGQYLNKMGKIYPLFVETYGYYTYNTPAIWQKFKDNKSITTMDLLKTGLTLHKTADYERACQKSKYLAILTQHLKGLTDIGSLIRKEEFCKYDLLGVLFQIYMPLVMLRNTFTHYDLHRENANVYEPVKGSYIEYHYHLMARSIEGADATVSFKSRYIAKLIDYGRSYFKDTTAREGSAIVRRKVCDENACYDNARNPCGEQRGFTFLNNKSTKHNFFINAAQSNISHDLRLLNDINQYGISTLLPFELSTLLNKVEYGVGMPSTGNEWQFGTKENTTNGSATDRINNVNDAIRALRKLIETPEEKLKNEMFYAGKTKLGDLHIHSDGRPMRYVPTY